VFVSYAHESPRHREDVLAFASFLRRQGVDAVLDTWAQSTRQDWYAWAIREMTEAAYVIVVASPAYRAVGDGSAPADRHRGVQSEATLLRELVYAHREIWTRKVLPVLLPGHGVDELPHFLSPYTASRYTVTEFTTEGAEDLLRVIHNRPGHVPPPVQAAPDLPPRPAPPEPAGSPRITNTNSGNANVVIQVGEVHGGIHTSG
jgi:SEFIR domain